MAILPGELIESHKSIKTIVIESRQVQINLIDGGKITVRAVQGWKSPEVRVDYASSTINIVDLRDDDDRK